MEECFRWGIPRPTGKTKQRIHFGNIFQKYSYAEVTSSDSMLALLPLLIFHPEAVSGLRRGAERSIGDLFFYFALLVATVEIKLLSFSPRKSPWDLTAKNCKVIISQVSSRFLMEFTVPYCPTTTPPYLLPNGQLVSLAGSRMQHMVINFCPSFHGFD